MRKKRKLNLESVTDLDNDIVNKALYVNNKSISLEDSSDDCLEHSNQFVMKPNLIMPQMNQTQQVFNRESNFANMTSTLSKFSQRVSKPQIKNTILMPHLINKFQKVSLEDIRNSSLTPKINSSLTPKVPMTTQGSKMFKKRNQSIAVPSISNLQTHEEVKKLGGGRINQMWSGKTSRLSDPDIRHLITKYPVRDG